MNNVVEQVKGMFNKNEEPFTAERAWIETTYGNGSYRPLEKRIKEKQEHIKNVIKGKVDSGVSSGNILSRGGVGEKDTEVVGVTDIDDIFKPFIEGGFNIINLSERIDEIKDENVYLISWKHAFNEKEIIGNEKYS